MHVRGPVEQLDCRDGLRNHTQEGDFNVAGAQYGARLGVLKAVRRLVERVVGGQQRLDLALQFLMVRPSDPLRAARPRQIAELNH